MLPTTISVFRSVRPHLTTEQAREVLRQKRPASLAEWDVALRDVVGTDASRWLPQLMRAALSKWAANQTDAREVLRTLTERDPRLGVWGACAVAETVLHFIPEGENRPRIAIETARAWVQGLATREDCLRVTSAASAYSAPKASAAAAAASAATSASASVYTSAFATTNPSASAAASAADAYASAAASYAYAYAAWREVYKRQLQELCSVIAEAILTFPVG